MSTFIKQNKLLTLIVGLFIVALLYYTVFSGKGGETPLLSSSDAPNASAQSAELLIILANLRTIRLNDSVFRDPVFLSLNDFGVVITPQSVGRRNPFSPVAADANRPQPIPVPRLTLPGR